MRTMVANVPASPSAEEYRQLEKELRAEFTTILQRCTMEGADHDSLHSYLQPMEAYFNLIGSGNPDNSNEAVAGLRTHLSDYDRRFE